MSSNTPTKTINQVWRTDWLSTRPVFYNLKTKKISHNVNDVIDFADLQFHPEGFNTYLDVGFSVLGQTPVQNVKFLPPNSEIRLTETGELEIKTLPDPVDQYIDYKLSETDIIDLIREKLAVWEKNIDGEIIVPLSGGYDSRLLISLFPTQSKIRAYTYGLSPKQEECFEVVIAQAVCKKLGIQWQQIELGDFHQYFDDWNQIFGVSIHAHGMYQVEFYHKILSISGEAEKNLVNGIGGAFTTVRKGVYPEIQSADDIRHLMKFHGMKADSRFSKLSGEYFAQQEYFENHFEKLKAYRHRKIELMRLHLMLLGYLVKLPEAFGMNVCAPLLDIDVATAILNLPEGRRENKQWLLDYFRKSGIDFSELSAKTLYRNTLNFQAIKRIPPDPLNKDLFKEIIEEDYIDWINRNLKRFGMIENAYWNFTRLPKINRVLKWVNIVDERKAAYFAYLTLKPIEYVLNHGKQ